jgi:endoglucanase
LALATAGLLLGTASGCGAGGSSGGASTTSPGSTGAPTAEDAFLSAYVTPDGRVLRHDQGDDVVSEGQAYAMLVAELANRPDVVGTVWSWTREHLLTSDGLLSFHADDQGKILDPQPAADADVLAAYALLRYDGPDADALHADGRALASAVLQHETASDSSGRPLLVAGPWATADPVVVNPSYLMPSVFSDLAGLTEDDRWSALATTSVDLVARLTDDGQVLPADWTRLEGDHLVPRGQGGGEGDPRYGPDAQRVPLWFAAACDDRARRLAASWWPTLQRDDRSSASALSLSGDAADADPSPVALLGAAAAARSAGDESGAGDLTRGAGQMEEGRTTYYGAAWLALAAGLADGQLTSCP